MLRHSQNMKGSRTEPQTAVSTSASCAKAVLPSLIVDITQTISITRDASTGKRHVLA